MAFLNVFFKKGWLGSGYILQDNFQTFLFPEDVICLESSISTLDHVTSGPHSYLGSYKIAAKSPESWSPHGNKYLAERALAGAGAAAVIANHRIKQGNVPSHRGTNSVGSAALGAIVAEVLTRARSRHREHYAEKSQSRSRSSSRSPNMKAALRLAVAANTAAAAVRPSHNRKTSTENARGRSRIRSPSLVKPFDESSLNGTENEDGNQEVERQLLMASTESARMPETAGPRDIMMARARRASRPKVKTGCSNCR